MELEPPRHVCTLECVGEKLIWVVLYSLVALTMVVAGWAFAVFITALTLK